jgi:hypothetical protein
MLGGITGEAGAIPRAGSVTVCAYCGGVSELDAELRPRPLTDEQVGALDPALRRQAYEGQAVIRSAVAGMLRGKRKPPVGEA